VVGKGNTLVRRTGEWLEHVIKFGSPGHHVTVLMENEQVFHKWNEILEASKTNFVHVNKPAEWGRWPRINQLCQEGRRVTMLLGQKSFHPRFWEATVDFGREIIALADEGDLRGVYGTPVPYPPR
jgi:hypothetical protein